jgi:predicted transcriptional regulator
MSEIQLGVAESRFAEIIWANVPVKTSELVKLAEQEFNWKRTTTHTVIKRLCDKGLFVNTKGTVTALLSREQFYSRQSEQFVNESFDGSLPAFIAAFTKGKKLSAKEAAEIRKMIDEAEEVQ